MTAIHDMTAGELLAAYKTKKLSPVEATDAVIAHIEAWEPKLKALYGDKVRFARYGKKRGLFQRFGATMAQDAIDTIEERAAFARFGL